MARTSEFDHGPFNRPDITMEMMPPYIDPIKARPDLTRYGEAIDQLKTEAEARLHREELLGYARKNFVTDLTGWGLGFASGVIHGAGYGSFGLAVGASAGYITAGVVSGIGELTGIPISDTLKSFSSQEVAQYSGQAVEYATNAASYIFPEKAVDAVNWTLSNFQTQVITGLGSISFGGYFVGKGWAAGWPRGDRVGRSIGAQVSFPVVNLVDKLPFDIPKMPSLHIPNFVSRILRRNANSE